MQIRNAVSILIALAAGGIFAFIVAFLAVNVIETKSEQDVTRVLELNGYDWAEVGVDGLQVVLSGFAPDEANRFSALTNAGTVVEASRVIDMMNVAQRAAISPPHFSIEVLRNSKGISLIGLIPTITDRESIIETAQQIDRSVTITDLLETADYPEPAGWNKALNFGLTALADLPRSKISISSGRVELKAISDSGDQKRQLELSLARKAPKGLRLVLDISAPRPVISPYTLRFIIDDASSRFDACSAYTVEGRTKIITAAKAAGLQGNAACTIGLGVPSPNWDEAVIVAIGKLKEIGGGSVTFSDADVTLVALDTTKQELFDQIVGELKAGLPDAFSLHAVLPEPVVIDGTGQGSGPPEFVATRSPEGNVRLRGRIKDERTRVATESFAQAQFGSSVVNGTMRLDADLPAGWSARVLASLEALAQLNNGSVVMQPDVLKITGITGDENARAEIARILSEKLGASQDYRISVTYEEKLDPLANIPTPKECVDQINKVLSFQQITFAPSSANIDEVARASVENIAKILKTCPDVPMEIAGHTDSQGREIMNQELSQSRAEAVVNALLARRILTANLTAIGYGEANPIADNGSESGREANRRIEFTLISPDTDEPNDNPETTPTEPTTETQAENTDEQN